MAELKVNNLSKSFGNHQVLNDIAMGCRTTEIVGVFGRNGSGKSTILKCIFGTLKADTINLAIDGSGMNPVDIIPSGKIGYLPQESFLPKNTKVKNAIQMYFADERRQDNVFYAPGINEIVNKSIKNLSFGQLRYFELVLVSFLDHPFLLLDEPFSMIEPLYKGLIRDFLIGLKEEKGIILTDHYYWDVLAVSDKNILIKDSKAYLVHDEDDLAKLGYLKKQQPQ
ncbi:ATP-binding cassette domain-containing protein [Pareuzebyella sediminis]|uniref:ATP-binding cassette domain-containing protein n=1 Tax=Pareuzebyella sediminis TaxID=2607998 RepID=UPI0011EF49BC|nr:ATP-binding cassette domain-containing protein [Pareuzebyella sediminis]